MTAALDFWESIDRRGLDACWEWKRHTVKGGYGSLTFEGHAIGAHRLAWILVFGDIPDDLLVCHSCDNPPCCNPQHLFLGTNAANKRDCVAKGRYFVAPSGEANPSHQRSLEWFASPESWRYCACGERFQVKGPKSPKRSCSKRCAAIARWAERKAAA